MTLGVLVDDAGRDGQGLLGWASGGPAGGRRVGAALRVAAHLAHNSNTEHSHIMHAQKKGRMRQRDEPHVTPRTTTTSAAAAAAAAAAATATATMHVV